MKNSLAIRTLREAGARNQISNHLQFGQAQVRWPVSPFMRSLRFWFVMCIACILAVLTGQVIDAAIARHSLAAAFTPEALGGLTGLLAAPAAVGGFLRTKIAPSPNSVASGKTATITLPIGKRYHTITLVYGYDGSNASKETAGTSANQIVNDIRIKINGKTQRLLSAKQLNAINSANGEPPIGAISALTDAFGTADGTVADVTGSFVQGTLNDNFQEMSTKLAEILNQARAGSYQLRKSGTMGSSGYREYLTIFLAEPWRKDISEQQVTAWNIHPDDVSSFQIEVDFATITTPFLDCIYTADQLTGRLGLIEKVVRQTFAVSGNAIDVPNISRTPGNFLQALHLFAVSDGHYVNKAKLTANGEDVHDLVDYLYQRAKLAGWAMNPDLNVNSTTNYLSPRYDLVLDFDDPLNSTINLGQLADLNLRLEFDASASGTIDVAVIMSGPAF